MDRAEPWFCRFGVRWKTGSILRNPGSEFGSGERNRLNPGSASSKFGEKTRVRVMVRVMVRDIPNSEPAEPGFGPVLSPNFETDEPRFSTVLSPNSEPAMELAFLRTPNLPNQVSAQSFLRTPNPNSEPGSFSPVISPNLLNQGSARPILRTPNLPNQGSALTFLQTCRTRVRPVPFSELPSCRPGFGPFLSPNPTNQG